MLLLASWAVTFLLHSTLWFAMALVLLRLWPRFSPQARDLLLKASVLGSLATASLPFLLHGLGYEVSRLPLPIATSWTQVELETTSALPGGESLVLAPIVAASHQHLASPSWLQGLLLLWGGVALGLLALLLRSRRGLRRQLAWTAPLADGRLQALTDRMTSHWPSWLRPRLRRAAPLRVPIAFGLRRPTIALPERLFHELGPEAQEAVLAHELGHLARRDPWWFLSLEVLSRLLCFQPLWLPLKRQVRQAAEECADAWAVATHGQALDLADSLTRIARWLPQPLPAIAAATAVESPSGLGRRVHRLLAPPQESRGHGLGIAMGLFAAVVSLSLPSFRPAPQAQDEVAALGVAPGMTAHHHAHHLAPERKELEVIILSEAQAFPTPPRPPRPPQVVMEWRVELSPHQQVALADSL